MDINSWYWEAEEPNAGQVPTSDPTTGAAAGNVPGMPPPQGGPLMGSGDAAPPQQQRPEEDDDVANDPLAPDMPDDSMGQAPDFEVWKKEFLKLAVKGDPQEMLMSVQRMRDLPGLEAPQNKFIEDNWNILVLRQNGYIDKASKEIRKNIKNSLDRNNPATSIMQYLSTVMEEQDSPMLRDVFIKLSSLFEMKAACHRKYLAALTGSVQMGGGGSGEDIAYAEKDYSVRMSTRCATQFGEISIGKWSLQQDDPERYLAEPELERLSNGSPEEKQVLRRRVVMESIAERYKNRAFMINVITPEDGAIYHLGWDMSESLLSGYQEGKLIVRSRDTADSEAMIDDEGAIVPLLDLNIYYLRETGQMDENGRPEVKEVPFMERRDGMLYLVASLEILRDVASGMTGIFFKEMPFSGNPSDLKAIKRAVPNIEEILMRRIQ